MNYVVDSYENYKEENRLTTNNARRIEFVTTTRVLDEIIGTKSKILIVQQEQEFMLSGLQIRGMM
mgnify:CR=1 FL=1